MDHVRKESLVALAQSAASEGDKEPPRGADTTTASPDRGSPSRKAYYESWDKFDVDQALNAIERDNGKPLTALYTAGSVKTTKPSLSPARTSSRSATTSSKTTASQSKVSDPIAAANAEKEKVSKPVPPALLYMAIWTSFQGTDSCG